MLPARNQVDTVVVAERKPMEVNEAYEKMQSDPPKRTTPFTPRDRLPNLQLETSGIRRRRRLRAVVFGLVLILGLSLGYLIWRQLPRQATDAGAVPGPAPVAAEPKPEATKAINGGSTPSPAPVAADPKPEIAAAIETWRAAWAARDLAAYLATYATDFQPADGQSLADWQALRKDRLRGARGIRLEIEQLSIEADGDRASARFLQHYRAGTVNDREWKRLDLVRTPEGWKIGAETVEGAAGR